VREKEIRINKREKRSVRERRVRKEERRWI
jgi:hypothetical protein